MQHRVRKRENNQEHTSLHENRKGSPESKSQVCENKSNSTMCFSIWPSSLLKFQNDFTFKIAASSSGEKKKMVNRGRLGSPQWLQDLALSWYPALRSWNTRRQSLRQGVDLCNQARLPIKDTKIQPQRSTLSSLLLTEFEIVKFYLAIISMYAMLIVMTILDCQPDYLKPKWLGTHLSFFFFF